MFQFTDAKQIGFGMSTGGFRIVPSAWQVSTLTVSHPDTGGVTATRTKLFAFHRVSPLGVVPLPSSANPGDVSPVLELSPPCS